MQSHNLPKITDVTDLSGKRVLLRAALNLPVKDGIVTNQFRLIRGLETARFLSEKGARVIMIGHIANNKKTEHEETLAPVCEVLSQHIPVSFCKDVGGADAKNCVEDMKDGDVVMLENLRRDPREKKNDADFARTLADLADIYVNDAFPDAHRAHASVVGVTNFLPAYAGFNFMNEYDELYRAMKPEKPAVFLLGGAKFETKMPLVEKFLDIYDYIFVGGALANDFFKAKGYEVGASLVSEEKLTLDHLLQNEKILLPVDVTVMSEQDGVRVTTPDDVQIHEIIMDAGPKTIEMLQAYIARAKTILWNGPFGNYEHGFDKETKACAKMIAASDAYSIVGGGDTVASIAELNLQDQFGFASTAGGAMLTFLEKGSLPAIDALVKKES